MLVFDCPSCGAKLQMPENLAGKKVRCATCQGIITAPADQADAITADSPSESAPAATGVTAPEHARASRPMAAEDDYDDDRSRRGPRRDGSTAAAATGIGVGAIVLIVVGVGACLLVPCIGVALLFPAVSKVRDAAARAQTQNNLKQIALAEHAHNDTFKFMPAPKHLQPPQFVQHVDLSWRVTILPFIEQGALFNTVDQKVAWDNPRNAQLSNTVVPVYQDVIRDPNKAGTMTHFQYFTGPGTFWPENKKQSLVAACPDGLSNTFLVAEANTPVPWSKPADMAIQVGQPLPLPADTFNVAFGDGSVRFVDRRKATDATLRLYIDPNDGALVPSLD